MISEIPLVHLIDDLYTTRMRGPELDQQAVEILPFLEKRVLNRVGGGWVDGNMLKGFRFHGLERCGDHPRDVQRSPPKRQMFEFCSLGEVKEKRP